MQCEFMYSNIDDKELEYTFGKRYCFQRESDAKLKDTFRSTIKLEKY